MATLRVLNVGLGAVLVGGMIMEVALILPTLRRLSGAATVRALQVMGPIAWRYLPVCGVGSTLAAIATIVLGPRFNDAVVLLTSAGVVISMAGMAVNLTLYLPLERQMRGWSPDAPPAELPAALARVTRIHTARTTLFSLGFVCYVVAAVLA
jgi:hypothetical protein